MSARVPVDFALFTAIEPTRIEHQEGELIAEYHSQKFGRVQVGYLAHDFSPPEQAQFEQGYLDGRCWRWGGMQLDSAADGRLWK